MNIRPLILGVTLTTAMLVAGCDKQNNDVANPDEMNNTGASTSTETNTPPATDTQTVGAEVDDGMITTKVKTALLADDTVKGLDINVETAQGVVSLNGTVDSQTQVDMAAQVAKGVEGVKDVQNNLTVKQ
jgi:hyperosmotically inducible protein